MPKLPSRRSGLTALLASVLAALIIGCGGGGGGGGGTNGNATSGNADGGTANGGTTPTDVTIGGATDAGAQGQLATNAIYFVQLGDNSQSYDVKYTREPSAGGAVVPPTTYASGLPLESGVATPDPSAAGKVVYALAPSGGAFGIYRGTNPSTAVGAQTLVSSSYDQIFSVQVSRDGTQVVFVAEPAGSSATHLYVAPINAPGTAPSAARLLDENEVLSAEINPDGTEVVYSRITSAGTSIYVRGLAANATPTLLVGGNGDLEEPQYSKGGVPRVAYSIGATAADRHRLEIVNGDGTKITVDPFPGSEISLRSPSFNSEGTRLAFYAEGPSVTESGIYTCDLAGANVIKVAEGIATPSVYWTTNAGRGKGGLSLHLSAPRKK